jgi:hypothetical protein
MLFSFGRFPKEATDDTALIRRVNDTFNKKAFQQCLWSLWAMILLQAVCMLCWVGTSLAGERSNIPILATMITFGFHAACAVLLVYKKRYDGQTVQKAAEWLTYVILVIEALLLGLARADVQHWLLYNMKGLPHSLIPAAELCEEDGDALGGAAEDICFIRSSHLTHSLALFQLSYAALFIVFPKRLLSSISFSGAIYITLGVLGTSTLHLPVGHGDFFSYSDFLWMAMCLVTMSLARLMLDSASWSLVFELEMQSQQALEEKVLRFEAEFKHSRLEEKIQPSGEEATKSTLPSTGEELGNVGRKIFHAKQPSSVMSKMSYMSAPAMLCRVSARDPSEPSCCNDLDCLPSDTCVWVQGVSTPSRIDTVQCGQQVLCYDCLSQQVKYVAVLEISASAKAEDVDWIRLQLDDGQVLSVTADHPIHTCNADDANSQDALLSCKLARTLTVSDEVMVLKMASVAIQSVSTAPADAGGSAWKLNVFQPDRHMVFVAGPGHDKADGVVAVGSSTTHTRSSSTMNTKSWKDGQSIISAPAAPLEFQNHLDARKKEGIDKRRSEYYVAEHLSKLDSIDPRRVLLVRRINLLGFEADAKIRAHFSSFGTVEDILFSGCRDEGAQNCTNNVRQRPSRFCFLVMSTPEEAAAALDWGESHTLENVVVLVRRFIPKSEASSNGLAEDDFTILARVSI